MAKNKDKKGNNDPLSKTVCRNRRARHDYEILDQLECGIVLVGSEVKSLRNGKMSIDEGFARVRNGELWLLDCDISEYPQATSMNHVSKRPRKLLLHKREFRKFAEQAAQKGLSLIPLAVYFSNGRAKVQIGLGRGRKSHDKRDKLRTQSDKREIRDAMMKRT